MTDTLGNNLHVTRLLERWRKGDQRAFEELAPLVYTELRRLATKYMRAERQGHTLQATALVNEAFMRLGGRSAPFENAAHFYGHTARLMRHILVDHAKAKLTKRRGSGATRDTEEKIDHLLSTTGGLDLVEIDDALAKLSIENKVAAEAIELHYFGGLTFEETAEVLQISVATVTRDLRFARAWLLRQVQTTRVRSPDDPV